MSTGFIKLHRSMTEWEWYSDMAVFRLFTHMLFKANHKGNKWQGKVIKRGQFISGIHVLSDETGLTLQQIRTAINKLKSTGEITSQSTNRYTLYSIENYEKYQGKNNEVTSQATSQATNEQQTNNHKQECKEVKNKDKDIGSNRKRFSPPSISDVIEYSNSKQLNLTGFFDYYESNGWMVGKNKMKDWKAAARGWSSRQSTYSKPKQEIEPNSTGWSNNLELIA